MVGSVQVFDMVALVELPGVGLGNTDGTTRDFAVTEPPSDLLLIWDPSTPSTDSVEIVLTVVVPETEELQDVAVLGTPSNTGSYSIPAAALDGFDLGGSFVLFKARRLVDKKKKSAGIVSATTTGCQSAIYCAARFLPL